MCKKCYQQQYQSDHREELKINQKQYRLDNKEKIKEYNKQYDLEHKEDLKIYNKQYQSDHKEEIKEKKKQYDSDHKEETKKRNKQYGLDHKEERNILRKQKRQSDPAVRIMHNASVAVNKMLKRNDGSKQGKSSREAFSFTGDQLIAHIEKQFSHPDNLDENGNVWMTWENQGNYDPDKKTWHLDHIIPQSKLTFNSYEHTNFNKCWALENLRPLEAIRNLKKGNKIIYIS